MKKSRGAALLALLSLVVIVTTTTFLAGVSLNKQRSSNALKNANLLSKVKENLIGYALRQSPPGILPCPDINNDGISDLAGLDCAAQRGLLPYKTLNMSEVRDNESGLFWYGVEINYTRETPGLDLNSSLPSSLQVDGTFGFAAVVIASRGPLIGQNRDEQPAVVNFNVTDYLEGINADADATTYTRIKSDTTNDLALAISHTEYWNTIEKQVLSLINDRLRTYANTINCNELPWASTDTASPHNSTINQEAGRIPFVNATAFGGAVGCPATLNLPGWVEDHWASEIHYSFCGPSGPNCINLVGDLNQTSNAILIAPGSQLIAQARPSLALNDYFEGDNSNLDFQYEFQRDVNHGSIFNDQLFIVFP